MDFCVSCLRDLRIYYIKKLTLITFNKSVIVMTNLQTETCVGRHRNFTLSLWILPRKNKNSEDCWNSASFSSMIFSASFVPNIMCKILIKQKTKTHHLAIKIEL